MPFRNYANRDHFQCVICSHQAEMGRNDIFSLVSLIIGNRSRLLRLQQLTEENCAQPAIYANCAL